MRRMSLVFAVAVLVLASIVSFGACSSPQAGASPVKIGLLRAFTGSIVAKGEENADGAKFALEEVGGKVAGRQVVLLQEDEGSTPDFGLAKARKLVEEDKVDVIIGPLLANVHMAVEAYLKQKGVPHVTYGSYGGKKDQIGHAFFVSARGDTPAYGAGLWAYDELRARTVTFLIQDYAYGYELRDGFTQGFVQEKGGKVVGEQKVPFGTTDLSPFLVALPKADVIAMFLVAPSDSAFVKQYQQYGVKTPVLVMKSSMQEEPALVQMGPNMKGWYGSDMDSSEIDNPVTKRFVKEFKAKYNYYPQPATFLGYLAAAIYLEALKNTGGDPDPQKITQALFKIKDYDSPSGKITFTADRVTVRPVFIVQVTQKDRWTWDVIKTYPAVGPRW